MTKVIINADDFGYSNGVNLGIVEAYQNGIVTSTTMMSNMPAIEHAAKLAIDNPGLGVGIHFVLTCGTPLASGVPSLVDDKGQFLKRNVLVKSQPNPAEIEKEFRTQLEKFLALGLKPTHFDSHHHVHMHPVVYPVVEKLALEVGVPVRNANQLNSNQMNERIHTTDYLAPDFYGEELSIESLLKVLKDCLQYSTAEVMSHPAYLDQFLYDGTSYAVPRMKELEILTSVEAKQLVRDLDIELVSFREI